MNKLILHIAYLFLPLFTIAQQNLVFNGDFEQYSSCPTSISSPGDYQIEHCLGWYSPTFATSDYFNECASWPVSIPNNTFGIINPQSGDAYCGILIENCTNPSCSGWWVEYLQSQLIHPLEANKMYEVSCYVALSNKYYQYSFSEFGVNLSNSAITSGTFKPLELVPTILNEPGNFISDTTNWYEFKSTFIANGGENYVTLGFFIDSTDIDTLFSDPFFDPSNYSSYYYIDNCSLIETAASFPNVFTPNGDGLNDVWKLPFAYGNSEKQVYILNRWGNLILQSSLNGFYWDGKDTNGNAVSDGVYFYKVSDTNLSGFIQLIH